jgi:hypothetical protein
MICLLDDVAAAVDLECCVVADVAGLINFTSNFFFCAAIAEFPFVIC